MTDRLFLAASAPVFPLLLVLLPL